VALERQAGVAGRLVLVVLGRQVVRVGRARLGGSSVSGGGAPSAARRSPSADSVTASSAGPRSR
jgi:hypothetical protein